MSSPRVHHPRETRVAPFITFCSIVAVTFALLSSLMHNPALAAETSVTVTGDAVQGATVNVESSFLAPGAPGRYIVDTEAYDSSGTKVAQWFETTRLDEKSTIRSYVWNLGTLPVGTYRLAQGIFNENWAGLRMWNSNAGFVDIFPASVSPAPAPPVTSSPTTTSAPPAIQSRPTGWTLSASVAGATPAQVQSSFTAASDFSPSVVILDTEIFDSNNAKVAQWSEAAAAGQGQTFNRTYNWDTTALKAGTYAVRQGVFSSDWSRLIIWKSDSALVNTAGSTMASTTLPPPTTTTTSAPPAATTTTTLPPPTTTTTTTSAPPVSTTTTTTTAMPSSQKTSEKNPLADAPFYVSPNGPAAQQANAWRTSRPGDASYMDRMAGSATASWFGNWNSNVQADVNGVVASAAAVNRIPILVAYNIPGRDCGSYSAGGANGSEAYRAWIRSFAAGIGTNRAAVILEPDALSQLDCLNTGSRSDRLALLNDAVGVLGANAGTTVYLDAGHARWHNANTMAERLQLAGVGRARGFSLNVSNFITTSESTTYGEAISAKLGNSRYVIDTSRNGRGTNGQWCNPLGRALGTTPTVDTGAAHADALLWIKRPGESDGYCNGGPGAGQWWPEYALDLAKAAWG